MFLNCFKVLLSLVFLLQIVLLIEGQSFSLVKSGSCPPPLLVGVCTARCRFDSQCPGVTKCCPTSCGGAMCTRAVTTRIQLDSKDGVCPRDPKGPWVCSSRCGVDTDCRRRQKCCKNKCGALACMNPES